MTDPFPFLTSYDPPGSSEGALDPLGLYQIANQLAIQLVPAVRERMQRIRFLTAMAVGTQVIEGMEDNPRHRDASPYLIWEWLVIEALIRTDTSRTASGIPGSQVTQRAINQYKYLDARSYLKTPRIFGFHGVYKRLAIHLGLINVHLGQGPNTEALVDAWARGMGYQGLRGARPLLTEWSNAIRRSQSQSPPRTRPVWGEEGWTGLASAFMPDGIKAREKNLLRELLLADGERRLGALRDLWPLLDKQEGDSFGEESLQQELARKAPTYAPLLKAIRCYERFARGLQDGFDALRVDASSAVRTDYRVTEIANKREFKSCVSSLHTQYAQAYQALGDSGLSGSAIQSQFAQRFDRFAELLDPGSCALALCEHHEGNQKRKSDQGKRPWFDRLDPERIHLRLPYHLKVWKPEPNRYVHFYRGAPIYRFHRDLS